MGKFRLLQQLRRFVIAIIVLSASCTGGLRPSACLKQARVFLGGGDPHHIPAANLAQKEAELSETPVRSVCHERVAGATCLLTVQVVARETRQSLNDGVPRSYVPMGTPAGASVFTWTDMAKYMQKTGV